MHCQLVYLSKSVADAATEGVSMKCELWHKLMISSCKHAWPSHFYCGRVLYPSPKNMHVLCRE